MSTIVFGDGNLGRAIAAALAARGSPAILLGRPEDDRHDPGQLRGADLAFEASRASAAVANVEVALEAGCRRFVIATTGWDDERPAVDALLRSHGAAAVAAANFSLGAALFLRLAEAAGAMFGRLDGFDPYVVEWHRRDKADRPSGTARDIARRLISVDPRKSRIVSDLTRRPAADELEVAAVRAGASPGMHLVGFDSSGESIELRIAARDRSAYAAGAVAAADWLRRSRRRAGLHGFDDVVDELLRNAATRPSARTDERALTPRGTPTAITHTTERNRDMRLDPSNGSAATTTDVRTSVTPTANGTRATMSGSRTDHSGGATRSMLRGAFTALVTPFTADGSLDEAALRAFVRWQVLAGIDGLVPCGTTGEAPTLSASERERVIALTVETVRERPSRSRVSIVAGTGTNDTRATIQATRRAAELGADAALVVAPYYNRPDGRMLEAHFLAVADEGDLPVVVYNVPSRTGTNVPADVFLRLAEHPRIIGVKEASGQLEQIATICRDRPADVSVLAGDDAWTLPLMAMGGDGVVSVASNEMPGEVVSLCAAAHAGDWGHARRIHDRCLPLFLANFRGGPNPVPVKAALALMGLLPTEVTRLPLLPLHDADRAALATLLRDMRLIDRGGRFHAPTRSVPETVEAMA